MLRITDMEVVGDGVRKENQCDSLIDNVVYWHLRSK